MFFMYFSEQSSRWEDVHLLVYIRSAQYTKYKILLHTRYSIFKAKIHSVMIYSKVKT